jgi:hypothetical protein
VCWALQINLGGEFCKARGSLREIKDICFTCVAGGFENRALVDGIQNQLNHFTD